MTIQTVEKIVVVILVFAAVLFLVVNLPGNPQLFEWVVPVIFAVIGTVWLIAYQGRQQRDK